MAVLGSKFDILRGWPHSSAVAEDFRIHVDARPVNGVANAAITNRHRAGEWVQLDAAQATVSSTTNAGVTSSATVRPALVLEGLEDYSAQFVGKVTCLLGGGYVVRLTNNDGYEMFDEVIGGVDVTGDYVPGASVKVVGSIITPSWRETDGTVSGYNPDVLEAGEQLNVLIAGKDEDIVDLAAVEAAHAAGGDAAAIDAAAPNGESAAALVGDAITDAVANNEADVDVLLALAREKAALSALNHAKAVDTAGAQGVMPAHDLGGANQGFNADALQVLNARAAAVGSVLRYDSSAKVLEIYVD